MIGALTRRLMAAFLFLVTAQASAFDQADAIFAVAYGAYGGAHGGVPWPTHRPDVRMVSRAEICRAAHYPEDCQVKGWYIHDQGEILLSDELDFSNVEDTTVLLHEDIHFLQALRQGPVKDCADNLAREQEAYRLQADVLIKVERPSKARQVLHMARQLRCPSKEF